MTRLSQIEQFELDDLKDQALELLSELIRIPSFSREESGTADAIGKFLHARGVETKRFGNNIWAVNRNAHEQKPTILLNSHHDTVKPNAGYTRDPFSPDIEKGRLYGLGSNDAGGCLVSLIATFLFFYNKEHLSYNLCLAATAEEEISGKNGIESLLPHLGPLDCAIVGEPTQMEMAIAEKGLLVLDVVAKGQAGHAARNEGINAIYIAMKDITWFSSYQFPKVSPITGPVKMSVTVINAGSQHNVVPSECHFVVDIRVNELYSHEEVLEIIKKHVTSEISPRSLRLRPSSIPLEHPLVQSGLELGWKTFGSPTMSDQALLPIPSLKIGPGDSARSHSANEYIYLEEVRKGISGYVELLWPLLRQQ